MHRCQNTRKLADRGGIICDRFLPLICKHNPELFAGAELFLHDLQRLFGHGIVRKIAGQIVIDSCFSDGKRAQNGAYCYQGQQHIAALYNSLRQFLLCHNVSPGVPLPCPAG